MLKKIPFFVFLFCHCVILFSSEGDAVSPGVENDDRSRLRRIGDERELTIVIADSNTAVLNDGPRVASLSGALCVPSLSDGPPVSRLIGGPRSAPLSIDFNSIHLTGDSNPAPLTNDYFQVTSRFYNPVNKMHIESRLNPNAKAFFPSQCNLHSFGNRVESLSYPKAPRLSPSNPPAVDVSQLEYLSLDEELPPIYSDQKPPSYARSLLINNSAQHPPSYAHSVLFNNSDQDK